MRIICAGTLLLAKFSSSISFRQRWSTGVDYQIPFEYSMNWISVVLPRLCSKTLQQSHLSLLYILFLSPLCLFVSVLIIFHLDSESFPFGIFSLTSHRYRHTHTPDYLMFSHSQSCISTCKREYIITRTYTRVYDITMHDFLFTYHHTCVYVQSSNSSLSISLYALFCLTVSTLTYTPPLNPTTRFNQPPTTSFKINTRIV